MTTNSDLQLEVNHLRNTVEAQNREVEQLTELVREGTDIILEQTKKIEVLTAERDNALLWIEKLERRLDYAWMPTDDKGGVNPNA